MCLDVLVPMAIVSSVALSANEAMTCKLQFLVTFCCDEVSCLLLRNVFQGGTASAMECNGEVERP